MLSKWCWSSVTIVVCVSINLFCNISTISTFQQYREYRVIETVSGSVRGLKMFTFPNRKPYYAFKGIPYAEPPPYTQRFKPPVQQKPWNGTRDALEFGAKCLQMNRGTGNIIGSENCLFLNIYIPDMAKKNEEDKLPVMFYIHGGEFQFGSGNDELFGPDFIMEENIILVTVNYRLAALGFLSLGTPEYSGNAGLKDQLLALKWIHGNIGSFGGDNKRITLSGHSAGSVSVHCLLLAQVAQGLYERAIMMGGSTLTPSAIYGKEEHLLLAFDLARNNGHFINNYKDLVKYLINVNATEIIRNQDYNSYWRPIAEIDSSTNSIFTKPALEYMRGKIDDVDLLIGYASSEALLFIENDIKNADFLEKMNRTFTLRYSGWMKLETEKVSQAMEEIRNFYFGVNGIISNETAQEYVDLYSDYFIYFIDYVAKMHAKTTAAKVYYYRLSADTSLNLHKKKLNLPNIIGATHGDELCYLFRCHVDPNLYNGITENRDEMKLIQQITKMWTNFVKFGNPSIVNDSNPIDFQPIDGDRINFLDIGEENLVMALSPHAKPLKFWNDFLNKYYFKKISNDRTEL